MPPKDAAPPKYHFVGKDALPARVRNTRHQFQPPQREVVDDEPWRDVGIIYAGRFKPFAKQKKFLEAIDRQCREFGRAEVGFGGAPGPGKTMALAFAAIQKCLEYPGYRWYIGRYNREDLEESTIVKFLEVLDDLKERTGLQYTYVSSKWRIIVRTSENPNACSAIKFIELKDPTKIKGGECDGYGIDEASDVPRASRMQLAQRLRGSPRNPRKNLSAPPADHWPLIEMWASNPGPGWCYNDYYLPWKAGKQGPQREFIRAIWSDNPTNPRDYAARILAADPGERTEALLNGDWAAMPGQVYSMFNRHKHVRDFDLLDLTGKSEDTLEIFGSYDWGKAHNTAILASVLAVDPLDGVKKCFIFDAYIEPGGELEDHATWMLYHERGTNQCIWYADRSIQTQVRDGVEDKIIEEFEEQFGLTLVPANEGGAKYSQRKGTEVVKRLLKQGLVVIRNPPDREDEGTRSGLEKLIHALETFSYPLDPITGEIDRRKFAESEAKDAADAFRYLLINLIDELDADWEEDAKYRRRQNDKFTPRQKAQTAGVSLEDARRLGLSYSTISRAASDQRKTQNRLTRKHREWNR